MQTLLTEIAINGPYLYFHAYHSYSPTPCFQQTEPSPCSKYCEASSFCTLKILFMQLRALSSPISLGKINDNIQNVSKITLLSLSISYCLTGNFCQISTRTLFSSHWTNLTLTHVYIYFNHSA